MRRAPRGLALMLWAASGAACGDEATAPAPAGELARPESPPAAGRLAEPPTIVLITLDTLRREHLGCYGYFRPTSPHLDALAREALLFERALASMASTLPSHLTLLTGLYAHQHGMTSNRRGASVSFTSELGRLSAADVLQRCGYRTAAFVSAVPLAPTTGVGAGFETYSSPLPGRAGESGAAPQPSSLRAGERNPEVLAWLAQQAGRPGPFFLWVHYFDPHEPNDPLPPYDASFATDAAQLDWIRARGIVPRALAERYGRSSRVQHQFFGSSRAERGEGLTLEHIADLMNRYDGEVRYMDEHVGALLEALRRHGRYEDAIVVVAGDHGQSLGENDWFGHGTITNVNAFVPLIVRLPRSIAPPPQRIGALVSLADVLPTLMARFSLPGSELLLAQFEGEDVLSGSFARDRALVQRSADEVKDSKTRREVALLAGRWKLLARADGELELFDLGGAGESEDVLARHADLAARLRAELDDALARRPALLVDETPAEADADLLKGLEELGYGGEGE